MQKVVKISLTHQVVRHVHLTSARKCNVRANSPGEWAIIATDSPESGGGGGGQCTKKVNKEILKQQFLNIFLQVKRFTLIIAC